MAVEKWTPERRRQLTRTALVDAARQVFARRGFEGASLEEIAETAGFTRGAIYKNFEGKEELFFAVFDDFNQRALAAFSDLLDEGPPIPEIVGGAAGGSATGDSAHYDFHALAATWQHFFAADTDMIALSLEFRLYEMRNPAVRERSAAQRQRNLDMIVRFSQEHDARLGLRLKIPLETLVEILLIVSDGFEHAAGGPNVALYETFLELFVPAVVENASEAPNVR